MIDRRRLLVGGCACLALATCGRASPPGDAPGTDSGDTGGTDSGDTGGTDSADTGGTDTADTGGTDTADTRGGDTAGADTASACDTGGSVEGWVEIPLASYPSLAEPGGWAYVDLPDALLHLVVAQVSAGCFVALWRICSHGACETEWDAAEREAVCPCHGSVFGEDGSVRVGPATSPLRSFPVVLRGASLFVER